MSIEPREAAFQALLPLANPTVEALKRVDQAVNDERKISQPLRKGWTPTQFATANGQSRFSYAIRELGREWEQDPSVARASSPLQELSQVFLWSHSSGYVLRVKHEPVEGIAAGAEPLFKQGSLGLKPLQIFLTWTVSKAGNIALPMFVCVEDAQFTIPLSQLVKAANAPSEAIAPRKPGATVKSTRVTQQRDVEDDKS